MDMTLEDHIDQVTKRCAEEIERIGLAEASLKMGVNRPYVCRFKRGRQKVTARKLIEFAHALGVQA